MNRQSIAAFIHVGFAASLVASFVFTAGVANAGGKPDGAKCHVGKSCRSGSCIRLSPSDKFGSCCAASDCASLGAQCGQIDNGCGTPIQCGDCGPGTTCVSNQCQAASTTTTSTSTTSTTNTNTTSTTVPGCPAVSCPVGYCNSAQLCGRLHTTEACSECVHDFACDSATPCTAQSDCGPTEVCVIDSCCGTGTGFCTEPCDATTTTTTLGVTTTTLGATTTTLGATTTTLGATTTTLGGTTTTMDATTTTLDVCANGNQDGDETGIDCGGSCGATCGFGTGCNDNADCGSNICRNDACGDKRVFVTSQSYNGNLGGLAGADTKCNTLASAAGLGGTWVAWLSATGTNAIDRIVDQQYRNMIGEVAFTTKFLMSLTGAAAVGIGYDESTTSIGSDLAWTASNASGLARPDNCDNWTGTTGFVAGTGTPSENDKWSLTGITTRACTESHRLICFEN